MSHKSFYLNTLWQYGLQIVKYILPLLVMPYLTRALGPDSYGVYAYILSFMTFAQTFVDFGFNLSGTNQIVAARTIREQEEVVGAISQARLFLCLISGVACAAIGFFMPIVRANAMYALISYVAVCTRSLAPDFLFQGREQMGPLTTRYLVSKSVSVLLTFLLVRSSADLLWVPILDVVAGLIALGWSFVAAKRRFGVGIHFTSASRAISELVRSGYYCASNMASVALSGVTTLVIGVAITDTTQIAYWSLAMSAIGAVQSLYGPIVNSLYPHMVNKKDFTFAMRLAKISIPFILLGSIAFYCLSDLIVLVLGGDKYVGAGTVLHVISPVVPLSFYAMYFGWPILGAIGHVKKLTNSTIVISILGAVALLIACISGFASVLMFALIRDLIELVLCLARGLLVARALQEQHLRKAESAA